MSDHVNASVHASSPGKVSPGHGFRTVSWVIGAATLSLVVFLAAWYAGGSAVGQPVDLIPPVSALAVPDFALIAQDGQPVDRRAFDGKVWVANFIYAQCPGPCPTLTARMAALQKSLVRDRDHVRLVSFSLEPLNDTPAVLSDYARRFHADTSWWYFLTGPSEERMHELVEKGFLQSVVPGDDDNPMMHSNYVAIVDRQGRLRAFFDGMDPESRPKIMSAVHQLLAESGA